jgi:gas vesicle protein
MERGRMDQGMDEMNRQIGELREEMQTGFKDVRTEIAAHVTDLRSEIKAVRKDVRSEIAVNVKDLRSEIKTEIKDVRSEMAVEHGELRADLRLIQETMETRFDTLQHSSFALMGSMVVVLASILAATQF